jgi:hypothetical protein
MSKPVNPELVQHILSRLQPENIDIGRKAGMADKEIAGAVILASVPKDKRSYLFKALSELDISTGDILSYLVDGITPEEIADDLFDGLFDEPFDELFDRVDSEAERANALDYIRTAYRILSQAISEYFGTKHKNTRYR